MNIGKIVAIARNTRKTTLGIWIGAWLLITVGMSQLLAAQRFPPHATAKPEVQSSQKLVVASAIQGENQQIILVDTVARTMAVYHVPFATGKPKLASVRKVHWDLQLDQFEAELPLPRDVQNMVQRQ